MVGDVNVIMEGKKGKLLGEKCTIANEIIVLQRDKSYQLGTEHSSYIFCNLHVCHVINYTVSNMD